MRQKITDDQGWPDILFLFVSYVEVTPSKQKNNQDIQFVVIATDCEGETALDNRLIRRITWVFQRARC